ERAGLSSRASRARSAALRSSRSAATVHSTAAARGDRVRGILATPLVRRVSVFSFSSQFPSSFLQRASQQKLDLAVQAAQVVVCPALSGVENLAVDSQQEWLALAHDITVTDRSCRC